MSTNQQLAYDNNMQVDNVSSRLSPEIWVKIFTLSPSSGELSKLRLVCKRWQAIIDEQFDMKVKLNDDKMDVYSITNFKRVVHCNVSKFCKEYVLLPEPIQLFWNPKILSTLNLRGPVTRPNFLLIAQQCQSVKEFILTGSLLVPDSNLFEVATNEEQNTLAQFMSGLQKLVVNGLHIAARNIPSPINLYSLLNWPMTKLKTLVIRANFRDAAADKMFFGLLENCSSMESIEFTFRSIKYDLQIRPIIFVLPTLCTLNIEVNMGPRLLDWVPFIQAQSSIKHLKMVATHHGIELGLQYENAILKNAKSLQSLELRMLIQSYTNLSLQFLGEFPNLKSLILHGEFDVVMRPIIEHLNFLPDAIETLVLENIKCTQQEFTLISDRVVNFQTKNIKF